MPDVLLSHDLSQDDIILHRDEIWYFLKDPEFRLPSLELKVAVDIADIRGERRLGDPHRLPCC
jgi:hypothetical protein